MLFLCLGVIFRLAEMSFFVFAKEYVNRKNDKKQREEEREPQTMKKYKTGAKEANAAGPRSHDEHQDTCSRESIKRQNILIKNTEKPLKKKKCFCCSGSFSLPKRVRI